MTLGEKIKAARKQNGLTQEELAGKMSVSRQAITKWESDKGIPDIENLRILSQLLDVSIDYLLDNDEIAYSQVLREPIDLLQFGKGSRKNIKKRIIRDKYPDAVIHPIIATQKLTKAEKIADALPWLPFPPFSELPFGIPQFIKSANNADKSFYLVEQGDMQLLVEITDEFMVSRRLASKIHGDKFEIDDWEFVICTYVV